MLSRHAIREAAFKALFALAINPDAARADVYAAVLPEGTAAPAFLAELVDGTLAQQEALDALIQAKLKKGWTLKRLTKPDLIVLRLGLYEMRFTEVDDKVAVNEAIELAKTYSDEQAAKFVNGILAQYVQNQA